MIFSRYTSWEWSWCTFSFCGRAHRHIQIRKLIRQLLRRASNTRGLQEIYLTHCTDSNAWCWSVPIDRPDVEGTYMIEGTKRHNGCWGGNCDKDCQLTRFELRGNLENCVLTMCWGKTKSTMNDQKNEGSMKNLQLNIICTHNKLHTTSTSVLPIIIYSTVKSDMNFSWFTSYHRGRSDGVQMHNLINSTHQNPSSVINNRSSTSY
jgi:hypothetical protein